MEVYLNAITDFFLRFISRFSFLLDGDYYSELFERYFSVGGFIVGFIFVLLVYFSGAEEQEKTGFIRILATIAVINCCSVLADFINYSFDQGFSYYGHGAMLNATDNMISGFIFTLVLISCYKDYGGRAYIFTIAVNATYLMLNFFTLELPNGIPFYHMVLRTILLGFVAVIITHREYFFTGWIWYFGFHVFMRIALFFLPLLANLIEDTSIYYYSLTWDAFLNHISRFWIDGVIFAVVLVFAIVFEKGALSTRSKKPI